MMNYSINPQSDLTTSIPITIEVKNFEHKPKLKVDGIGDIELKGQKVKSAQIYFRLPGEYRVTIQDGSTIKHEVLNVSQHEYLDFKNEFGFFFILFLIVMGGVVLWTRKIMKNKTE